MTLLRTLQGMSISGDLERAYVALAGALLRHRGGGLVTLESIDPVRIDDVVCSTERHVDLRVTRSTCPLIDADEERPGEIFNNLGHMFVLLQAIPILREKCSLVPVKCAPTQQSKHEGERIADLQGPTWALEAYGGIDITNNDKLALDLRTLSVWRAAVRRTFLACREIAFPAVGRLEEGAVRQVSDTCSLRRGGPFSAEASIRLVGRLNGVVVVEVESVTITPGV